MPEHIVSQSDNAEKKVFALLHAPYEEPCSIAQWFYDRSIPVFNIHLWNGDSLPDPGEVSFLIIMGGPMNIYQHDVYPWLIEEKKFIGSIIKRNVPVLGICLGAQLLSDVLGGKVTRLPTPEYGWISISRRHEIFQDHPFSSIIPQECMVFSWHQDTFSIPDQAIPIYSSASCQNQGFIYNHFIVGLQFHPELDEQDIRSFLSLVEKDTGIREYEYPKEDILNRISLCKMGHAFLKDLLPYMASYMNPSGSHTFF
ncbi:type 1 glutamine amidotransferase [Methanospirillum sp.]|uniref:type 1 glutamine amidotransferase n=1 Tax=Methanospirillum sp. TaxID=45200 RepID=UPI002BF0BC6C|nr:type 1 glutamine amidotransferase [Methanospirillum sp.]HPP77843.1 type 1 glutamine amidotransferase [Methanospirillum sp.]